MQLVFTDLIVENKALRMSQKADSKSLSVFNEKVDLALFEIYRNP
jgi:hypothetical protein